MNGQGGLNLEEQAQIGIEMQKNGEMDEHLKAMWAGQSNVLVAVRVRPLMKHDVVKKSCVRVLDSKVVIILDPASGDKQDVLRLNRNKEKQYAFDFAFEPGSSQESVYHHTTKFLIHGVLDGYNATVFAYGQTGSGKTYTMIGSQSDPGIMVRVMGDLFTHSVIQGKQQGVLYKVSVSFLEVYNENIRDLLSDVEEYLDLREDPIKGPVVASITEIEATSGQEIMQLLQQGNARRSQAATAANEVSSRSHAVLQVVVESRDRAPGVVANIKVGKLSLVDLAGSERAANTKNVGQRLLEGANINRSLLALGNCINALGEKGNKGNFVPYRDSKLTRLLKDSLGGNCRTVMIANISAAESSFEETLNTLKYANRAKNIKTHVQRNVLNVNYHISEYVQLINNLRSEIQVLKGQIGAAQVLPPRPQSSLSELVHKVSSSDSAYSKDSGAPNSPFGHGGGGIAMGKVQPSTPLHVLRESLKSGAALAAISRDGNNMTISAEGREIVNVMRQRIVENFQERMQLRRSLIELEDQNVQNSIEVGKRQLLVVQWSESGGLVKKGKNAANNMTKQDFAAEILASGNTDVIEAWQECEQLRKAIVKNNGMKKNIAKRLRHNEREAENFRDELGDKITGEDRRELMELQYQVGRLELENMELEQHRIVHESILKGKDLIIQKLQLQLAVRDKLINRQQAVLVENGLDGRVGYSQLALMEQTIMGDVEFPSYGGGSPQSPPKNFSNAPGYKNTTGSVGSKGTNRTTCSSITESSEVVSPPSRPSKEVPRLDMPDRSSRDVDQNTDEFELPLTDIREVSISSRDRDVIEAGDWSEVQNELSDSNNSFVSMGRLPSNPQLSNGIKDGNVINANRAKDVHGHYPAIAAAQQESSAAINKGVQGPRGGRHFRTGSHDENSAIGNLSRNNSNFQSNDKDPYPPSQMYSEKARPVDKQFLNKAAAKKRSKSEYFHIENSDDDSILSGKEEVVNRNRGKHNQQPNSRIGSATKSPNDKLDPIPLERNTTEEGILSGRKYEVAPHYRKAAPQQLPFEHKQVHSRDITPRRNSLDVEDGGSHGLHNRKGEFNPSPAVRAGGLQVNGGNYRMQPKDDEWGEEKNGGANAAAKKDLSQLRSNLKAQRKYQAHSDKEKGIDEDDSADINFNDALMVKAKPVIGMKPVGLGNNNYSSNSSSSSIAEKGGYNSVRPQQPQPSGRVAGLANIGGGGSNTNSNSNLYAGVGNNAVGYAGGNNANGNMNGNGNNLSLNVDGHSYGDRPPNPILAPVSIAGVGPGIGGVSRPSKIRPAGR